MLINVIFLNKVILEGSKSTERLKKKYLEILLE